MFLHQNGFFRNASMRHKNRLVGGSETLSILGLDESCIVPL